MVSPGQLESSKQVLLQITFSTQTAAFYASNPRHGYEALRSIVEEPPGPPGVLYRAAKFDYTRVFALRSRRNAAAVG